MEIWDCYHRAKGYVCKIASAEELNRKWDYEIAQNPGDGNWLIWKEEAVEDLRKRGFTKAILGVAVADDWHQKMYEHWGFTEYLKTGEETYPDGTIIDVEYYGKKLLSIVEKMRQEIVRRSDLFEAKTIREILG